jgi:signal transduction histidine kinase/integral membrane sensor domain MASE1/ActR/RegA family two-component response regulator
LLWPTSGVALALILHFGWRAAFGVFAGTLVANSWVDSRPLVSLAVSLVNALEPLLGAFLILRFANFRRGSDRLRDLLALAGLGGFLASGVGAALGVAASEHAPWTSLGEFLGSIWMWWVADGLGVLIFAPALLSWLSPALSKAPARQPEAVSIFAGIIGVAWLAFLALPPEAPLHSSALFLVLPFLAWAALRLTPALAHSALLLASVFACLGVKEAGGLLQNLPENQRMWLLAMFQGVCALTVHVVGTSTSERRAVEQRLQQNRQALFANNRQLESIRRIQARFIAGASAHQVFDAVLEELRSLTGSESAIIARTEFDAEGDPSLRTLSIAGGTLSTVEVQAPEELARHELLTPLAGVLTSQRPVISNDPSGEARARGLQKRPANLQSFLGLPLHCGSRFVGVVGLANRPGGYDLELAQTLEPVLGACGNLVEAHRSEEAHRAEEAGRKRMERELAEARRLEALGTLAGGIAHDFNNVLAGIRGNAELAELELAPESEAHAHIGQIIKATERARLLVNQILTFSRSEKSPKEPVDLRRVVHSALGILKPALGPGVDVRLELDDRLPSILGSESQLEQAVLNLLTNATQALGPGGGTLRVGLKRVTIDARDPLVLKGLEIGEHVLLQVGDNGRGMLPSTLERAFEPYFTTRPDRGGTGLGLSVVHGVVQEHFGAVRVWSQPQVGTVFELFFPAIPEKPRENLAPAKPKRGRGQHVLLVDDEGEVLTSYGALLKGLGYRVTTQSRPEAALEAFRTAPLSFDCCITDYSMHGMNGVQLARALRQIRPDMPIGVASGFGLGLDEAQLRSLDLREVLPKPYSLADLTSTLERLLPRQPLDKGVIVPSPPNSPPSPSPAPTTSSPPGTPRSAPGARG